MHILAVRVYFTILICFWLFSCGKSKKSESTGKGEAYVEKKLYKLDQYVGEVLVLSVIRNLTRNGWSPIITMHGITQ